MQPLTAPRSAPPFWVGIAVAAVLVALGPAPLATVVGGVTSLITSPVTGEVEFSATTYEIRNLMLMLVWLVAVMGLNLLFQVGVISIGQSASVLVGAYTVALLTTGAGWTYWVALVAAVLLSALVGLLLGLPGLRLGAFTFVMVTIGYAFVAHDLVLELRGLTGGGDGLQGIERPVPFEELRSWFVVVGVAVVLVGVLCRNHLRSALGREAKAVETNATAAASLGITPSRPKIRAFVLSSALGGLAGGLYAPLIGFVAPEAFSVPLAVLFVLMVLLGGRGTVWGPLIGVLVVFRIPLAVEEVTDRPGDLSLLVYGVVLLVSVHLVPRGLITVWWWSRRRFGRASGPAGSLPQAPLDRGAVAAVLEGAPLRGAADTALRASGLVKQLGGVRANDDVDIAVNAGEVHALIGPNGSGKTTLLNLLSGYLTPDSGTVVLGGTDVTRRRTEHRVRAGLARTFQTPAVFEAMSCLENVLTADDLDARSDVLGPLLRTPAARRRERAGRERALAALGAVGLGHRVDADVADLTAGERRFLELARVLVLRPRIALMDEPAAGLVASEIEQLEEGISALRASGIGVLLVEHHVEVVMRLADRVSVLDFGRIIAAGPPQAVRDDPRVVEAYFGAQTPDTAAEGQG